MSNNQDELIARCKAKVAQRPHRAVSAAQLANGVPMFLNQSATPSTRWFTVALAFTVLESGSVPMTGSTGTVMKRGLHGLSDQLDQALREVKAQA